MVLKGRTLYLTVAALIVLSPTVTAEEMTTELEEMELPYAETLQEWQSQYSNVDSAPQLYTVTDFADVEESESDALDWADVEQFSLEAEVAEAGLYNIRVDYRLTEESLVSTEGAIRINGGYPFSESRGIHFPSEWVQNETTFEQDLHGADIMPSQSQLTQWQSVQLSDSRSVEPFAFALEEGMNTIEFIHLRGAIDLTRVTLEPISTIPTYDEYINRFTGEFINDQLISIEAEHPTSKMNRPFVRS
ncbi:N-acetyl-D-glucosamine ABC transport system, sugar-binding protein [Bacillus sp. JCM 19046]|nr:N-acetyl-D-glucosamine ABC transport system, sugar-binding protein [Bacillus sp. JCM 19046]